MKKILFATLFGILVFGYTAKAQWINLNERTSFNFVAPANASQTVNEVLFPIAETESWDYDTNDSATIVVNQMIHVFEVDTLEGNMVIDVEPAAQVSIGAIMLFKLPADGIQRTVKFDTGFYTHTTTVTASTTAAPFAIYDGTAYRIIE